MGACICFFSHVCGYICVFRVVCMTKAVCMCIFGICITSLVGGDTCTCVVCACIVVACVGCCVFACELCSRRECFCSMFILFVVSEFSVYLQSSVKVCCVCGILYMNGKVETYMCMVCMCK